jgi:tetratricopeptide (TPR) repeat protein/CHAT domain-containing protein
MRSHWAVLGLLLLLPAVARGQQFPTPTAEGKKALGELLQACEAAGALKTTHDPKGAPRLVLTDAAKLKAAVAENRPLLTPATRDALVARWKEVPAEGRGPYGAALRALGQELADDRALAFAALFLATAADHQGRLQTALKEYQEGARCFALCRDPGWQAICLTGVGGTYGKQGQYDQALETFQRVVALDRKVHGDRHPLVATSLTGVGMAYHYKGEPARALENLQEALAIRRQAHGDQHPLVAGSLTTLGIVYEGQGEQAKALDAFRRALAIHRKVYGGEHPTVAAGLDSVGRIYLAQGEYDQALDHFTKALALDRKLYGDQHPTTAAALYNLGITHRMLGKYPEALEDCQQALAIQRKVYGDQHPTVATTLSEMGEVHVGMGDLGKALERFQEALALRQRLLGKQHPDTARDLSRMAAVYTEQAEYARALDLSRQALAIFRTAHGSQHPSVAGALNNLGLIYLARRELGPALDCFQQALAIGRKLYGNQHPNVVSSLNNVGGTYIELGEYGKGIDCLRQALAIQRGRLAERHPDVARALNNLGEAYSRQEEYGPALDCFQQALTIWSETPGESQRGLAVCLHNLGLVHFQQEDFGQAVDYFRRALDLARKSHGERHPLVAHQLSNLGEAYSARGEYAQALDCCRQALAIRRATYGNRHPEVAMSLRAIGTVCYRQRKYDQALSSYEAALQALRVTGDDRPVDVVRLAPADFQPLALTVHVLEEYGLALEQTLGSTPTAAEWRRCAGAYALAARVADRVRQEVIQTEESKAFLGAQTSDLVPQRLRIYQRLFEREGDVRDLEAAFLAVEQGTARAFLETLVRGRTRARALGGVSRALATQEDDLLKERAQLDVRLEKEQDKPLDQRNPEKVEKLLHDREGLEAGLRQLVARIQQAHPQYAALNYPQPCTLAEARACLGKDEVALLYLPGREASYVLLVEGTPAAEDRANGLAIYRLPAAEALAEQVAVLTDANVLALPARMRVLGAEGYAALLAPLADRLRGKDLVIVPGGALCLLPFELLVEDGHYLVERHRIRYAPSLTALHLVRRWNQARTRPERPLWALADPVYGKGDERLRGSGDLAPASQDAVAEYLSRVSRGHPLASQSYPRLRHSGQEVQAIRAILGAPDDAVRTGLQASEAAVKAASEGGTLAQARYVHFATHGILGLDVGRQPSLVLSLVGNEGEDGFLQLDEVLQLQLNADLVVLSACQSGRGRLYNGEGVRGLSRAFLYAGSRAVLCSLWSVDDAATADLMADVYRQLKAGQPAPEALRGAQLAMIRAGKAPLYWAPFILIGE